MVCLAATNGTTSDVLASAWMIQERPIWILLSFARDVYTSRLYIRSSRMPAEADFSLRKLPAGKKILYPTDRHACGESSCAEDLVPAGEYAIDRIVGWRKRDKSLGAPRVEFLMKWEGTRIGHVPSAAVDYLSQNIPSLSHNG